MCASCFQCNVRYRDILAVALYTVKIRNTAEQRANYHHTAFHRRGAFLLTFHEHISQNLMFVTVMFVTVGAVNLDKWQTIDCFG